MGNEQIKSVGEQVLGMLADTGSGIIVMSHIAERISRIDDVAVSTARNWVRRAIEQCPELDLMELTTRRNDWDVMLPDGPDSPDGPGTYTRAWISQAYDSGSRSTVYRFVFARDQVGSNYGSGRTTWITTRANATAAATARREKVQAELDAQRKADEIRRREETRERWSEAASRDEEYVGLLRQLEAAVPGAEVRVVPSRFGPGFFVGMEVMPESGQAFKTFLRTAFPQTCTSTFTPPTTTQNEPRRTWRCDGDPGHASEFHGGPADDEPGNRAAWTDVNADVEHPGEPTVVSLRNVYAALAKTLVQRDQSIAAWQRYAVAMQTLLHQAQSGDTVSAADVHAAFATIPAWARPAGAVIAEEN